VVAPFHNNGKPPSVFVVHSRTLLLVKGAISIVAYFQFPVPYTPWAPFLGSGFRLKNWRFFLYSEGESDGK
jgi:hypothetical protein